MAQSNGEKNIIRIKILYMCILKNKKIEAEK